MKNKLIPVLAIASIFLASCSVTPKKNADENPGQTAQPVAVENTTPVTDELPAFKLTAADGSTIDMSSLKGKKVFINLWATWCPPCKAEIPSIEKLYAKVDKANTEFVMLSLDDDFETAKTFAQSNKMSLPVYHPGESLPPMFNTGGIPATFIFDEKGHLIKMSSGMDDYDTEEYVQLLKSRK